MVSNKNNDTEIKFANWNGGYDDIFLEIKEIRAIQNKVLFDLKNKDLLLNQYFTRVSGLFTTHGHYILEQEKLIKILDDVESVLFSDKYLLSIANQTNLTSQQVKIYKALKKIFALICESFSYNGLTMKVLIKKRKASMNENLTAEEKEELEALEEVGIM